MANYVWNPEKQAYFGTTTYTKPTGVRIGTKIYEFNLATGDIKVYQTPDDGSTWKEVYSESFSFALDANDNPILKVANMAMSEQATHDNLNANANLQISDTDVSSTNPVPTTNIGTTIKASGTATAATTDGTITTTGFNHIELINDDTSITITFAIDENATTATKPITLKASESYEKNLKGIVLHYASASGTPSFRYILT